MGNLAKEEVSKLSPLLFEGSDEQLVHAIRSGHVGACTALYDRYVNHVRRVLTRILGVDSELPDMTNEVFYQALKSIHNLKDPSRLKAWVTRIAVFTGRRTIRGRQRRNWLRVVPPEDVPEIPVTQREETPETDMISAVRQVLDRMPPDERIVFSLRYMEGMEIKEIADACDYSLRTAKRRLAACESRFKALAQSNPALKERLEESGKWRKR